jgi:hypothetical protein
VGAAWECRWELAMDGHQDFRRVAGPLRVRYALDRGWEPGLWMSSLRHAATALRGGRQAPFGQLHKGQVVQLPRAGGPLQRRRGFLLVAEALVEFGRLLVQHNRPLVRSQFSALGRMARACARAAADRASSWLPGIAPPPPHQ